MSTPPDRLPKQKGGRTALREVLESVGEAPKKPDPVVVAKGRGFLAGRIRALAGSAQVPVLRMPALARALYAECDIDGPVPEALYGQLAPIYRQLFAQGRAAR